MWPRCVSFFWIKLYIKDKSFSKRISSLILMCELGAVITTNHSEIRTKYYTFSPKYYNRQHKVQHKAKSEVPFLSSTSTLNGHLHLGWWQSCDAALLPKYSGSCCAATFSFTYICGSEVVGMRVISKGSRISRAQEPNWHRSHLLVPQWQFPPHHYPPPRMCKCMRWFQLYPVYHLLPHHHCPHRCKCPLNLLLREVSWTNFRFRTWINYYIP